MPYPNYKKSTDKQHKAVSKQKIDTAFFYRIATYCIHTYTKSKLPYQSHNLKQSTPKQTSILEYSADRVIVYLSYIDGIFIIYYNIGKDKVHYLDGL